MSETGQVSKLASLPGETFSPGLRGPGKTFLLHQNEAHKCWKSTATPKPCPQPHCARKCPLQWAVAVTCVVRVSNCKQKRKPRQEEAHLTNPTCKRVGDPDAHGVLGEPEGRAGWGCLPRGCGVLGTELALGGPGGRAGKEQGRDAGPEPHSEEEGTS